MKRIPYLSRSIIGCITILGMVGCASVSTDLTRHNSAFAPSTKPQTIYITDFSTIGEFNVDRQGQELAEFKRDTQKMMTTALVERFRKHLGPSYAVFAADQAPAGNHILVTGSFALVNQGSRALRAGIGFGAGGTKMETAVYVYNLSNSSTSQLPFLTFRTTGGSGAMPGAVSGAATASAIRAAVSAISGSAKGLTEDTLRTSRMITAEISDFYFQKGWIAEEDRLNPKQTGQPLNIQ